MDKMSRLSSMVGKTVRLDRGGPESRTGQVLAVQQDFLVLFEEKEGVIYYKTDHIKSLSVDAKDYSDLTPAEGFVQPNFIQADSFNAVLETMKHRWVKINRGGPESAEGLLTEIFDDYLLLTINNELVNVFNFHIRSISYKSANQNDEASKQESQKQQSSQANDAGQAQSAQQENSQQSKQEKSKEKNKDKNKKDK
jgi:spore coat protein B